MNLSISYYAIIFFYCVQYSNNYHSIMGWLLENNDLILLSPAVFFLSGLMALRHSDCLLNKKAPDFAHMLQIELWLNVS